MEKWEGDSSGEDVKREKKKKEREKEFNSSTECWAPALRELLGFINLAVAFLSCRCDSC